METLLLFLIYVVVILLVVWAVGWLLDGLRIPHPAKVILMVLVGLVMLMTVVNFLGLWDGV